MASFNQFNSRLVVLAFIGRGVSRLLDIQDAIISKASLHLSQQALNLGRGHVRPRAYFNGSPVAFLTYRDGG